MEVVSERGGDKREEREKDKEETGEYEVHYLRKVVC